jgi:hypothetical protein
MIGEARGGYDDIYLHICISIHRYVYVCVFTNTYLCMYIYIYIYIYRSFVHAYNIHILNII